MSAGYSGTPLTKKLGIRAGDRVWLIDPPPDLLETMAPLPEGVSVTTTPGPSGVQGEGRSGDGGPAHEGRFDVVLSFCPEAATLPGRLEAGISGLTWTGGLWICWPKKSSRLHRDLAREDVRDAGLASGLVDHKVCAVDDDWSGLRFVVRVEDRPEAVEEGGPMPRPGG